jgi:hypothetical protein
MIMIMIMMTIMMIIMIMTMIMKMAMIIVILRGTVVEDVLCALKVGRALVVELRLIRFAHGVEDNCWTSKP